MSEGLTRAQVLATHLRAVPDIYEQCQRAAALLAGDREYDKARITGREISLVLAKGLLEQVPTDKVETAIQAALSRLKLCPVCRWPFLSDKVNRVVCKADRCKAERRRVKEALRHVGRRFSGGLTGTDAERKRDARAVAKIASAMMPASYREIDNRINDALQVDSSAGQLLGQKHCARGVKDPRHRANVIRFLRRRSLLGLERQYRAAIQRGKQLRAKR